jgi:hypothetical protein
MGELSEMKWLGWLCKTIVTTAIMTAVSVTVTWLMINIYIQQLLGPLQGEQIARPVALSDLVSFMMAPIGNPQENLTDSDPNDTAEETAGTEENEGTGGTDEGAEDTPVSDPAPPKDALPVMGNVQSEDQVYLSTDELDAKKDSISSEDRMEIFSILMSRLPPEEIQKISKLLEGGITSAEIREAANILKEHLNEQEYEKLIGILMKY